MDGLSAGASARAPGAVLGEPRDSELCGLRFGRKPLPLEIRLETRHAGSGHERVAWLGGSGSLTKIAIDTGLQSSKGLMRARESFQRWLTQ